MTTIAEDITKIHEEITQRHADLERISILASTYPNLRKHIGRWGKTVYCSSVVNSHVTGFDARFNCGCCDDTPLEIWPYLDNLRVYSDPPMFCVGQRVEYHYAKPYPNWEEQLRDSHIPEELIEKIGKLFEGHDEARTAYYKEEENDNSNNG